MESLCQLSGSARLIFDFFVRIEIAKPFSEVDYLELVAEGWWLNSWSEGSKCSQHHKVKARLVFHVLQLYCETWSRSFARIGRSLGRKLLHLCWCLRYLVAVTKLARSNAPLPQIFLVLSQQVPGQFCWVLISFLTSKIAEVLFGIKLCKGIDPSKRELLALSSVLPSSASLTELEARLAYGTCAIYSVAYLSAWTLRLS